MAGQVIKVENLTKKFKELAAVNNISFAVNTGEVFGFLGPNGAGKTTTIKMITTIMRQTSGEITVNGSSTLRRRDAVREAVGLIFQEPSLDNNLTVRENLFFHARLYHLRHHDIASRVERALTLVGMLDRQRSVVRNLSGGMKRRVEIARGMLHEPKILFLDEPTIGLDPQTRQHIWNYILGLKQNRRMTIFLTTHYMEEAEYCDRIAVIDNGRIIALDTPANLKRLVKGDVITLQTRDNRRALELLKGNPAFSAEISGDSLRLVADKSHERIPQLFRLLGDEITGLSVKTTSLDDVFIQLTGHEIRDEGADVRERMKANPRIRRRI
jgi:ABC-2 type transport system ATP-binding protein